jgi:hypothetical protein
MSLVWTTFISHTKSLSDILFGLKKKQSKSKDCMDKDKYYMKSRMAAASRYVGCLGPFE